MRLVVVSNRVALPEGGVHPGGMTVGVKAALQPRGGVWLGWSGHFSKDDRILPRYRLARNGVEHLTLDLPAREFDGYYSGFSNQVLWPLLHGRPDLIELSLSDYQDYLAINGILAEELIRNLRPDDLVWVHDYHLIPLADALRRRNVANRIGFFLHTPFARPAALAELPMAFDIARFLCAYDLLGFQTGADLQAWRDFFNRQAFSRRKGISRTVIPPRSAVFPIGIDTAAFETMAAEGKISDPSLRRAFARLGPTAVPIIGVDRLDYSKGIPERLRSFGAFLKANPAFEGRVGLIQVAPRGREDVPAYRDEADRLEHAFLEFQASPCSSRAAHLLRESVDRASLAAAYRKCPVGLVTPLHDGMNLVAKEYVAAQDPADPGVLILSRFAGAARELETGALLVDPYDTSQVAGALSHALTMPRQERIARWETMIKTIRESDAARWGARFTSTLAQAERRAGMPPVRDRVDRPRTAFTPALDQSRRSARTSEDRTRGVA